LERNIFNMFNIVVKIHDGIVYEISWDNGCYSCDQNCKKNIETKNIFDNNEAQTYESCFLGNDEIHNTTNLEPKFYVTWFGTDKKKRQLKSSGMSMSKFKPYLTVSFYSKLKKLLDYEEED